MQPYILISSHPGSAQAQNLRDSGVKHITIGNRDDVSISCLCDE